MNGYEILGKAVANGILYIICSAFLGLVIYIFFDEPNLTVGIVWKKFYICAWIAGCLVCIGMVLWCIYH